MITQNKITFWMNMPSPHMDYFINALADIKNYSVKIIYISKVSEERIRCGFRNEIVKFETLFLDVPDWKNIVESSLVEEGINVFGGLVGFSKLNYARNRSVANKTSFYVVSETGDNYEPLPLGANLIRFLRMVLLWNIYKKYCKGIFSIGLKAEKYFRKVGVAKEKLFPFIYTVKTISTNVNAKKFSVNAIKMIFVGRVIPLKAIDDLVLSFGYLPPGKYFLDIFGTGSEQKNIEQRIKSLGLLNQIVFKGSAENDAIRTLMSNYDILMLPSRYDGWGAVVNEAISAGLPVICSTRVGASDLVRFGDIGGVVPPGCPRAIAKAILKISETTRHRQCADNCKQYAKFISPEIIADYFISVLEENKASVPPWVVKKQTP